MINSDNFTGSSLTNHHIEERHPQVEILPRHISTAAWIILVFASVVTFVGFMVFDPNPDLLLSVCVAANVAIILRAIYRLYQLDLLLSPMMVFFIGPSIFMYYSWGNLGARIAGEARYAANLGTLAYYPEVALLSTIGLFIYYFVVFVVLEKKFLHISIRYQDMIWRPRQVIIVIFFIFIILSYLSIKYNFTGGYFRDASSNLDRWLIAIVDALIYLLVILSVSVRARAENKIGWFIGTSGLFVAIVLSVGLRSRTFMLMVVSLMVVCWITLRPKSASPLFFIRIGIIGILVFSLGTAVKLLPEETFSVGGNLTAVSALETSEIVGLTSKGVDIDRQYRTGGFEFPAALLRCLDYGAEPAYGKGVIGAALQGLPGFLRPAGSYSERGDIATHYWRYCFFYDDSMAIPLVSGIGDWGKQGVIIYVLFGLFSLILWRVAQYSPKLFLVYLCVPFFPDSLFWDGVFTYFKMMGFLWIIFTIFYHIVIPTMNHELLTIE